ncbi:hypothetical protein N657DRAFT_635080 [Parathielavia appendiculata]|uniref:Uncharacterized protein n=1 Tax=Parathielavia appendiculata TaxID=2587402 RepID=A0AAN6TX04_9PEZI|nr:hypothetical protein N657DRAFT_635080 [Parathielavia appendiculata]
MGIYLFFLASNLLYITCLSKSILWSNETHPASSWIVSSPGHPATNVRSRAGSQPALDAERLRALAADYRSRASRTLLRWLWWNRSGPDSYRACTWGCTILRTAYTTTDVAFQTAVDALYRYMRAVADAEIRSGVPLLYLVDPRPSEEFYVNRFINDVLQDRERLENATVAEACAYFRRWALYCCWYGSEERYFSSAVGPRLKTAILFDDETAAQLQGVAKRRFFKGELNCVTVRSEHCVMLVEVEPKGRGGPGMDQGVTDCFRVRLVHLLRCWFDRDRKDPAYMLWEVDERSSVEWFFTDGTLSEPGKETLLYDRLSTEMNAESNGITPSFQFFATFIWSSS